jgi:ribosomal protein L9
MSLNLVKLNKRRNQKERRRDELKSAMNAFKEGLVSKDMILPFHFENGIFLNLPRKDIVKSIEMEIQMLGNEIRSLNTELGNLTDRLKKIVEERTLQKIETYLDPDVDSIIDRE